MESPHWSRLLAGTAAHGEEPTQEQSVPDGLYTVERIHAGAVCGELQSVGRSHIWGSSETKCYEPTATPIPQTPVPLGAKAEELGMKLSLGRREGGGKVVLIVFYFSLSFLINFPKLGLFCT